MGSTHSGSLAGPGLSPCRVNVLVLSLGEWGCSVAGCTQLVLGAELPGGGVACLDSGEWERGYAQAVCATREWVGDH